jgi:hypothetical protein
LSQSPQPNGLMRNAGQPNFEARLVSQLTSALHGAC